MKQMIFFLLIYMFAYSQDFEPSSLKIIYGGNPNPREIYPTEQTSFINGFEVGHDYKMDSILNCNTHFGAFMPKDFNIIWSDYSRTYYPLFYFAPIEKRTSDSMGVIPHWKMPPMTAMAIEWEPTLEIPESQRGSYIEEQNNNNYVFGFSEVSSLLFSGGRIR